MHHLLHNNLGLSMEPKLTDHDLISTRLHVVHYIEKGRVREENLLNFLNFIHSYLGGLGGIGT